MGTIEDLWRARALAREPRPFLTWVSPDQRTELGGAAFANWVEKAANAFRDELQLGPGGEVSLAGGSHWTTAVAALAAWRNGAGIALTSSADRAVSIDDVLDVLDSPDEFRPDDVDPASRALEVGEEWWDQERLATAAAQAASRDRLLTTELVAPHGLVEGLLGALAGGGSLVVADGLDPEAIERLAATERVARRLDPS